MYMTDLTEKGRNHCSQMYNYKSCIRGDNQKYTHVEVTSIDEHKQRL